MVRTVQQLEEIGAAGIQLEDQPITKRCGHFAKKTVVDVDEMCLRILAAVWARKTDLVIIARTDALSVYGLDEAIARANRYLVSGADVAFIEAPTTAEQVSRIPLEVNGPVLANMVEGGRTPAASTSELESAGFRIALFANTALRLATHAVETGMRVLHDTGSSESLKGQLTSWDDRQRLVGLAEFEALEEALVSKATGHRL